MQEISFFDCNAYIGRTSHPEDSLAAGAEELCRDMARIRLNRALVFHKEALNDPVVGNRLLIEQIAAYPQLSGCAVLAPEASGEFGKIEEYFAYLVRSGIRAIRLFPKIHFYTLKPYVLNGVLEQAAKWQMPVLVDCVDYGRLGHMDSTWDYMPDFDGIYELAREWPQVPFLIISPGMTSQRQQYAILQACPNVYLDTSGYSYRFQENVCARFSAERLLAGSYMPCVDPACMMACVLYAEISEEEKRLIAGGNLERLLARVGRKEEGAR
jgi:predicted TIM-barrel fold metal-dependent hydrolase